MKTLATFVAGVVFGAGGLWAYAVARDDPAELERLDKLEKDRQLETRRPAGGPRHRR